MITKNFKFEIADLLKNRSITFPSLTGRQGALLSAQYEMILTPLEMLPDCSAVPPVAGLHSRIIQRGLMPRSPARFRVATTGISNGVYLSGKQFLGASIIQSTTPKLLTEFFSQIFLPPSNNLLNSFQNRSNCS